ncbi:hypothetical protein BY996DRAFT_6625644 [Phakopsora pachyrhizi]|nr:hypothetical protein BY996DRAFT_6625644 [Phakopsora pachyrhizi]
MLCRVKKNVGLFALLALIFLKEKHSILLCSRQRVRIYNNLKKSTHFDFCLVEYSLFLDFKPCLVSQKKYT